MANGDDDPAGLNQVATMGEQVRSGARWVLAAFAAVGAAVVPGLGLAGIGSLDGWRLWVAIAAMFIAILAAIVSIAAIVRFLAPSATSLDELARRERCRDDDELVDYFARNTTLFQGQAKSLGELEARRAGARSRVARLRQLVHEEGVPGPPEVPAAGGAQVEQSTPRQSELDLAEYRLALIETVVTSVESVASFHDLRFSFAHRRWVPAAAAVLVAVAVAAFGVAAHEPARDPGDFSGRTLSKLDLSGTKLVDANFSHATLRGVNLRGADLHKASLDGTRFIDCRCPDGTRTRTAAAASARLTLVASARTSSPRAGAGSSKKKQPARVASCRGHLTVPRIKFPILKPTGFVPRLEALDARG